MIKITSLTKKKSQLIFYSETKIIKVLKWNIMLIYLQYSTNIKITILIQCIKTSAIPAPATRLIRTSVLQLISAHRGWRCAELLRGAPARRAVRGWCRPDDVRLPRIPVFTGIAIDTRLSFWNLFFSCRWCLTALWLFSFLSLTTATVYVSEGSTALRSKPSQTTDCSRPGHGLTMGGSLNSGAGLRIKPGTQKFSITGQKCLPHQICSDQQKPAFLNGPLFGFTE